MEKRFNNLHNKIIRNLEEAIKNCTNQQINIQSKIISDNKDNIASNEWKWINKVTNQVKKLFNINIKIPSANDLIFQSPSKMYIKEYMGFVIQKIKEIKKLTDKIVHEKDKISPYSVKKMMHYYFTNLYSLLLRLNIKELRQSINFITAFGTVYFPYCFLSHIKKFDSAKDGILNKNDYYYQWKLQYPQKQSPEETFEKVLDDPNGNLSFKYNLNDLKWIDPDTNKLVREAPIQ